MQRRGSNSCFLYSIVIASMWKLMAYIVGCIRVWHVGGQGGAGDTLEVLQEVSLCRLGSLSCSNRVMSLESQSR